MTRLLLCCLAGVAAHSLSSSSSLLSSSSPFRSSSSSLLSHVAADASINLPVRLLERDASIPDDPSTANLIPNDDAQVVVEVLSSDPASVPFDLEKCDADRQNMLVVMTCLTATPCDEGFEYRTQLMSKSGPCVVMACGSCWPKDSTPEKDAAWLAAQTSTNPSTVPPTVVTEPAPQQQNCSTSSSSISCPPNTKMCMMGMEVRTQLQGKGECLPPSCPSCWPVDSTPEKDAKWIADLKKQEEEKQEEEEGKREGKDSHVCPTYMCFVGPPSTCPDGQKVRLQMQPKGVCETGCPACWPIKSSVEKDIKFLREKQQQGEAAGGGMETQGAGGNSNSSDSTEKPRCVNTAICIALYRECGAGMEFRTQMQGGGECLPPSCPSCWPANSSPEKDAAWAAAGGNGTSVVEETHCYKDQCFAPPPPSCPDGQEVRLQLVPEGECPQGCPECWPSNSSVEKDAAFALSRHHVCPMSMIRCMSPPTSCPTGFEVRRQIPRPDALCPFIECERCWPMHSTAERDEWFLQQEEEARVAAAADAALAAATAAATDVRLPVEVRSLRREMGVRKRLSKVVVRDWGRVDEEEAELAKLKAKVAAEQQDLLVQVEKVASETETVLELNAAGKQ